MKRLILNAFGVIGIILIVAGCKGAAGSYTSDAKFDVSIIGPLQQQAIDYQGIYRNPVIIVHGFLGSNLIDKSTGENIWGKFSSEDSYTISDQKMEINWPFWKKRNTRKVLDSETVNMINF